MATFEVKVHPLTILEHPNADRLELAQVGDYLSIVLKGQFKNGDLAAYIPEGSIVPDRLITEMGLEGKLAGPKHNRVKAVKLRGILSQGLVYGTPAAAADEDLTALLGITKYEPEIPLAMRGEVENASDRTLRSDFIEFDNIKKHPTALKPGEEVIVTEKIHGTWCCLGRYESQPVVTSKGMSAQGLAFKHNERNQRNIYVRQWHRYGEAIMNLMPDESAVYILGEVFGPKIQDLKYGRETPEFRVFDIYSGAPGKGRFLSHEEITQLLPDEIAMVPVLYIGPYDKDILSDLTRGQSTLAGHIREGAVVKTAHERNDPKYGRMIFKSVSEDYLLRKGGSEYN